MESYFNILTQHDSILRAILAIKGRNAADSGDRLSDNHAAVVKSPDDWMKVADRELANLKGSYIGAVSNDAKIDHALKATEATLKAVVWRKKGWLVWPRNQKPTKYLYSHNFEAMLDITDLRQRLRASDGHWTSWQVLVNAAVKFFRYSPDLPSDAETHEVAKAARYPDTGVIPWLRARYQEMP